MSHLQRLQLLCIKPILDAHVQSLLEIGWVETSEWLECPRCSERYQLLIDASQGDASRVNVIDLSHSMRKLTEQVNSEHEAGHQSDLLIVECESTGVAPQQRSVLNLEHGDRVMASWPAAALRDCRCCCQCGERSFRVVQIRSCWGMHRYAAFCADHFTDACLETAELAEMEFAAAMLSKKI